MKVIKRLGTKIYLLALVLVITGLLILPSCTGGTTTTSKPPTTAPATTGAATTAVSPKPTATSSAAAAQFNLKLNMIIPATHLRWTLAIKPWMDELEQRTNGRVKVTPFFPGALTASPQVYDSVRNGLADFGETNYTTNSGYFPLGEFLGLGSTPSVFVKNLAPMFNEIYNKSPALQNETKDVKILVIHGNLSQSIGTTKKAINTLADLKGLKINVTGGSVVVAQHRALGLSPVSLNAEDVYDALSKGVMDGSWANGTVLNGRRWADVIKYLVGNIVTSRAGFFLCMNWNTWNKMPKDIQDIITSMTTEKYTNMFDEAWYNDEQGSVKKVMAANGVNLIKWSAADLATIDKLFNDVALEQLAKFEAEGKPMRPIFDAFKQLEQKYKTDFPY